MNRKNYISVSIFLGLFIVSFIYLNKLFITNHQYENTIEDFKNLSKKTNIDVVFLGSSRSFTTFNPLIINNYSNTISFNLGADAQRLPVTNLVFEETLKYTKPKLVILEIYPPSIMPPKSKKDKGLQLRALNYVSNFSKLKFKTVNDIYNVNEYTNVFFPIFRNHVKWNNINFKLSKRKKINPLIRFYSDGYVGYNNILSEKERNKYLNFKNDTTKKSFIEKKLPNRDKKELIKFINISKNNNIKILLISSPHLRAKLEFNSFYNEISKICNSYDVPFLNLNNFYNELNITLEDFRDKSHVNIDGGTKVSNFLANYINANFSLKERNLENIWKEKKRKYDEFFNFYYTEKTFIDKRDNHLTNNIMFDEIKITKKRFKHSVKIKISKTTDKLSEYKLAMHIYPIKKELDLLTKYSKSKNRKFDLFDIYINKHYKDNIISFDFKTKIKQFSIKLFLYKKDKGTIGEIINMKNIDFKEL